MKDKEKAANGEASAEGQANGEAAAEKPLAEALKEPSKPIYCYSCGIDCTRVRYHKAASAPHNATGKTAALTKYDVCPTCFLEARFPANSHASEFTKLENEQYQGMIRDKEAPWSDQETLLLLEGLELFDEDWNQVADHVGTRSREECVVKFLTMEIEDKYLDPEPTSNGTHESNPTGSLAYLSNGRVPFTQADNPVMSVLGFLAGLAEPSVTAAAAGKGVEEMKRLLRERIEKADAPSEKGKEKETAKEGDKPADANDKASEDVKHEDSMDVDAAEGGAVQASSTALTTTQQDKQSSNPLATLPLALSAARSAALASHEERQVSRLLNVATNLQLQKLDLKLKHFSELEAVLSAERRDIERRRQELFMDRLSFANRVKDVEDAFDRALTLGPEEGKRVVREAVMERTGSARWGVKSRAEGEGVKPMQEGDKGFAKIEI